MQLILGENKKYVLRFDRGEEVLDGLKRFCDEELVRGGSFNAVGGTEELTLAFYDLEKKKYENHELKENLEILSMNGVVSRMGDDLAIHAHGTFGDKKLGVRGGHVIRLIVSGTCEVVMETYEGDVQRTFDEETGLNLLA